MKHAVWRLILASILATIFVALPLANADTAVPAGVQPAKSLSPAAAPEPVGSPYGKSVEGLSDFDKWCECIKKPCDWFCWGADFQARNVYSMNTTTLASDATGPGGQRANETEYTRFRARIWSTFALSEDIDLNARFIWEAFNFYEPEFQEHVTNSQGQLDNLNLKFKNLFDKQATLVVGRQDIFLGDGWLVAEGTPFDGSLTGFFDAARLTYTFEESPTTADFIYIHNEMNPNAWLHPINEPDPPFWNAEQDESGAIVYFTNKSVKDTDISPYFMYKKAESTPSRLINGYDGELYTPGLRVAQKYDENWRWRAEGAYQFGRSNKATLLTTRDTQDVQAFGANAALQYFVNDPMNNNFRVQYEFLSGNSQHTGKYEGFDTLWGRWARWSDLWADETALEQNGRKADYTNLHRIGPGWSFSPSDKFTVDTDYYLLFADASQDETSFGSDNGLFRGQLVESVLTYKFNKHIAGHLKGELFCPDRKSVV